MLVDCETHISLNTSLRGPEVPPIAFCVLVSVLVPVGVSGERKTTAALVITIRSL